MDSTMVFALAQATALAAGFFMQVLVARTLSVPDYGRFVMLHSASLGAIMLLTSAIPPALKYSVSVTPTAARTAWRIVWRGQLPVALASSVVLAVLAPCLCHAVGDPRLLPALWIATAEVAAKAGIVEPCWHLLNGAGWHRWQAALMTGHSLLRALCVACAVAVDPRLEAAASGLLLSAVLSLAVAMAAIARLLSGSPSTPDGPAHLAMHGHVRRWIRFAPLADAVTYGLAAWNVWWLRAITAEEAVVGRYAACYVLAQAIVPLGLALSRAYFAPFAQAIAGSRTEQAAELLCRAVRVSAVAAGLGIGVAFLRGDMLLSAVYGSRFAGSGPLLGLLSLGMAGMAAHLFVSEMMGAAGLVGTRLLVAVGVAAVSIPATVLLTWAMGAHGAAWGLVVAGAAAMSGSAIAVARHVRPRLPAPTLARVGFAVAALVLMDSSPAVARSGPIVVPGFALVYGAVLAILGEWRTSGGLGGAPRVGRATPRGPRGDHDAG